MFAELQITLIMGKIYKKNPMSQQSFGSFKELLIKKKIDGSADDREVRYDILTNIFRFIQSNIIINNLKHFDDNDQKAFMSILNQKAFKNGDTNLSNGEYEAIVRDETKEIDNQNKLKLIDLLESDVKKAMSEKKKIDKISRNLKSSNPQEEKEELEDRIKDLHRDIIDIEMNLMSLENNEQQNTERFKKTLKARDKRKLLVGKLEKQLSKLSKLINDKKD
jgi:hypothetical protein